MLHGAITPPTQPPPAGVQPPWWSTPSHPCSGKEARPPCPSPSPTHTQHMVRRCTTFVTMLVQQPLLGPELCTKCECRRTAQAGSSILWQAFAACATTAAAWGPCGDALAYPLLLRVSAAALLALAANLPVQLCGTLLDCGAVAPLSAYQAACILWGFLPVTPCHQGGATRAQITFPYHSPLTKNCTCV